MKYLGNKRHFFLSRALPTLNKTIYGRHHRGAEREVGFEAKMLDFRSDALQLFRGMAELKSP